jgi:hypothetical protein
MNLDFLINFCHLHSLVFLTIISELKVLILSIVIMGNHLFLNHLEEIKLVKYRDELS